MMGVYWWAIRAYIEDKGCFREAAAEAKVVILASVTCRLFVCSKSAVSVGEMEAPSFLVLHTKEASVHLDHTAFGSQKLGRSQAMRAASWPLRWRSSETPES